MKKLFWTGLGGVSVMSLVLLLLAAPQSQAAFTYSLRFDKTDYLVNPGSTLQVDLILSELATGSDVNRIGFYDAANDRTYGVLGAEFKINWAGALPLVASKNDAKAGPGFAFATGSPTLDLTTKQVLMKQTQANVLGDGVIGESVAGQPGLREVLLGKLTFTVPTNFVADVITLDQETMANANDFLIKTGPDSGNRIIIDSLLRPGSATLTAVPEPSSIALMGMAMAIGGGCWWRKRRAIAVVS
jgi:hypothetical protein